MCIYVRACVVTDSVLSTHHALECVLDAGSTEINQTQALP